MPCTITGSLEGDALLDARENQEQLLAVTQLLCALCYAFEKDVVRPRMPKAVNVWWKKHKKIDAARIRREHREAQQKILRAKVLKKLTRAERAALEA